MDSSTGLSITVSCNDIDGALQFVSDLLEPEIIKLRFWGKEGDDYCVDENGLFYLTEEQEKRWMTSEEKKTLLFLFLFSTSRRKAFRWNQCVFTGISDNGIL